MRRFAPARAATVRARFPPATRTATVRERFPHPNRIATVRERFPHPNQIATVRERFPRADRTASSRARFPQANRIVTARARFLHANRTAFSRARLGKRFLLHGLSPIDGLCGHPGREVVMPVRMKWRAKPRDRGQPTEDTALSAPLADDPKACYTDTKAKFRVLCVSI